MIGLSVAPPEVCAVDKSDAVALRYHRRVVGRDPKDPGRR